MDDDLTDDRVTEGLAAAIATVEDSRRTHVEWRDHLRDECAGPERCPTRCNVRHVGSVEHHERCIAEYDNVLRVLRAKHATYVAPAHWPTVAWDALLDRYFAGDYEPRGSFVLLAIPDEIAEQVDEAMAAIKAKPIPQDPGPHNNYGHGHRTGCNARTGGDCNCVAHDRLAEPWLD